MVNIAVLVSLGGINQGPARMGPSGRARVARPHPADPRDPNVSGCGALPRSRPADRREEAEPRECARRTRCGQEDRDPSDFPRQRQSSQWMHPDQSAPHAVPERIPVAAPVPVADCADPLLLFQRALEVQEASRFDEAEALFRHAIEALEARLGKEHPDTLVAVINLGFLVSTLGRPDEAEVLLRRALEVQEAKLGKQHPHTLATVSNLGLLLRDLGRFDEAEVLLRHAIKAQEAELGKEHVDTLLSVNNLGLLLQDLGRLDEAKVLLQRVLSAMEAELGKEYPDTLASVVNLGLLLRDLGRRLSLLLETQLGADC